MTMMTITTVSSQAPWWWVPLIAAIAGAISGGASAIIVGSPKAEREERGKRRIDSRRSISKALRAFRYAVSEVRLSKFNLSDSVDYDAARSAAELLASTVQSDGQVLPTIERWRLTRATRRLLGRNLLTAAALRAPERHDRFDDSALQAATAIERQAAGEALFGTYVLNLGPTDSKWDVLVTSIDHLRRRYP